MTKHIQWNGTLSQEGYDILKGDGGCIVCPTKVGYIIMTSDKAGLERKFEAKERNRNKPGVVLCGSMDELRALAQLNPEIEAFYQKHWDEDILLGCILPWKPEAFEKLKAYGDGLSADVLKLGHHGSDTSSQEKWLNAVDPEIAVCCVGWDNSYGHPSPKVLERLEKRGVTLYRTDRSGTVVVTSDGEQLSVQTEK